MMRENVNAFRLLHTKNDVNGINIVDNFPIHINSFIILT